MKFSSVIFRRYKRFNSQTANYNENFYNYMIFKVLELIKFKFLFDCFIRLEEDYNAPVEISKAIKMSVADHCTI